MSHYVWSTKGVSGEDISGFAARLEKTLNDLETQEFEIYNVMDAPGGRRQGVIVIGRKPRRFPATQMDPRRLKGVATR